MNFRTPGSDRLAHEMNEMTYDDLREWLGVTRSDYVAWRLLKELHRRDRQWEPVSRRGYMEHDQ